MLSPTCPGVASFATAATYVGKDVTVTAMYAACAPTTAISACWDGSYRYDGAPIAWVDIRHQPNGDCLELEETTFTISIAPIVDDDTAFGRIDHMKVEFGASIPVVLDWWRY